MSYSFSVRAASVAALVAAASVEFDRIVASQAPHAKDRPAALATIEGIANVITAPADGADYQATVSGSLGGAWTNNTIETVRSCNLSVNVTIAAPAA